jgi:AcrR family transcriptional regulator
VDQTPSTSRIALRRRAAIADGSSEYVARRARLIETAALVFQEKGYAASTLQDIAERFGTDRASLYYYVGSKDELLNECIAQVLDANLAEGARIKAGPGSPRSKLAALITTTLRSFEEHYPYAFVYVQENMSHIASQDSDWAIDLVEKTHAYEGLVRGFLLDGISDGSIRSDLPPGLLANGLYGMMNWTHRWFIPGESWVAEELADAFLAVFFEGVATEQLPEANAS